MLKFVVVALLPVAFATILPEWGNGGKIPDSPQHSATLCIEETNRLFDKTIDWEKYITYDDISKDFTAVPLSFAYWNWCWYRIDDQVDLLTKIPSSAATRNGAKNAPASRHIGFENLAKALETCEQKKAAKELNIKIIDDPNAPTTQTEAKTKKLYKDTLELITCVNEHYTKESDYDANIKYIKEHDIIN